MHVKTPDEIAYEESLKKSREAAINKALETDILAGPIYASTSIWPPDEDLEPLIAECENENHDDLMNVSDKSEPRKP